MKNSEKKVKKFIYTFLFVWFVILTISILNPSNLAHLKISKFLDSIPTYSDEPKTWIAKDRGSFPDGAEQYSFIFTSEDGPTKVFNYYETLYIKDGWKLYETNMENYIYFQ